LRHEGGHFIGEEPPIDTEMPGAFDFRGASDDEFLLFRVVHEEVPEFLGMSINIAFQLNKNAKLDIFRPEDHVMVIIVGCY